MNYYCLVPHAATLHVLCSSILYIYICTYIRASSKRSNNEKIIFLSLSAPREREREINQNNWDPPSIRVVLRSHRWLIFMYYVLVLALNVSLIIPPGVFFFQSLFQEQCLLVLRVEVFAKIAKIFDTFESSILALAAIEEAFFQKLIELTLN